MFKAKKAFSQNFLVDATVISRIVDALPLADTGNTVLEVGAGQGALTLPLLQRLQPDDTLTVVEVDPGCIKTLNILLADDPRCRLLGQNMLGVWPEMVAEQGLIHVVGNLPYHMTGQILFHFCGEMAETSPRWRPRLASFTLMVQQEVAERLLAQPGDSAINPLTWSIRTWFTVEPVLTVPPQAFRPKPRVWSGVIQLQPRTAPLFDEKSLPFANALIKAGFRQPRKTLRNNWKAAFGAEHPVWQAVPDACWDRRAHTVALEEWQTWSNALAQ